MQKITPFLWFNANAEEAMNFYVSVFSARGEGSRVKNVSRYTEAGPGPAGTMMVGVFDLYGQEFLALNGGPQFTLSEAVSFVINCETQEEIDYFWEKFSEGGEQRDCGWIKDRFGLSWQIVPTVLGKLMSGSDTAKSGRVMQALMQMKKIDIAALEQAYNQA